MVDNVGPTVQEMPQNPNANDKSVWDHHIADLAKIKQVFIK